MSKKFSLEWRTRYSEGDIRNDPPRALHQAGRPFYESDLIKIITGIRRCGKSVLLEQIAQELENKGCRVLRINFEDRAASADIPDDRALLAYVTPHIGSVKLYLFLDEVQMVKDWHLACRTLRLKNTSVFITGSNARLLSKEFTKELSGRYVSFCVRPFIYRELSAYAAELGKTFSVGDYLVYGGFPKILEFDTWDAVRRYLSDLDETIVIHDIINRYKIRKEAVFRRLVNFILLSNARIFSANAIRKVLAGQNASCSPNTIMKYIGYLEEAYVIRRIPQYSMKAKRELSFSAKLYDEDVAFNTIRQRGGRYDLTHNLENIVYNELFYRGYTLSVFRKDKREIDFLAERQGKSSLVQVAYTVADESTYEREFALFNSLDQSQRKILITNDEADFSTSTVEHIPLSQFLLNE